ncbi:MAG TPA: hypothetical protein VHE61_05170, partial [Opitutaceae bacterium]|nr:hypothetical protein [Opitutaceae bacterium]
MNLLRLAILALVGCGVGFAAGAPALPVVGQPLPAWTRGELDIHQINTGTGNAAFFIFPDGTTLLLDAASVDRSETRPPFYDAPPRPDRSLRPGQWIVQYIRRMHPDGPGGALDYAMLTHFHDDHMGSLTPGAPKSKLGSYRLTGITDVGDEVPIRRMLDRGWPGYDFPRPLESDMIRNYRRFLAWQHEHRGLVIERFVPGRNDQLVLRRDPRAFPTVEIRNLAANGWVWTGTGTETRNRFTGGAVPDENNCSLAFRLTYGAFRYFNGGDMTGMLQPGDPACADMESAVAWVTGPVDVLAEDHHGYDNAASGFFLSVLQPRVHILSVYAASQPSPGVMRRMLSEQLYPGPRDIFLTNTDWPGRREHLFRLFGPADA